MPLRRLIIGMALIDFTAQFCSFHIMSMYHFMAIVLAILMTLLSRLMGSSNTSLYSHTFRRNRVEPIRQQTRSADSLFIHGRTQLLSIPVGRSSNYRSESISLANTCASYVSGGLSGYLCTFLSIGSSSWTAPSNAQYADVLVAAGGKCRYNESQAS